MVQANRVGLGALLGIAWAVGAGVGTAEAARVREFRASGLESILKGKLEGVAVTPEGALSPSPQRQVVFTGEVAFVWALIPDGEGGVYASTGSEGGLYRIRRDGSSARVAQTLEYELFSLARGDRGGLYVSGAPNGTITRVDAAGATTTVVDLPEGLVWDLLVSPKGVLFASTGESGEVYRITPQGQTERVGLVPDVHVVTLAWWQDRLLCGTDSRGLLATMDPQDGSVEILFDTDQEEVVAVLPLADGRVLFAANGRRAVPTSDSDGGLVLPPIEVRAVGAGVRPGGGPRLYERTAAGLVRTVWECPEEDILSLALAPDGEILVGTGSEGVIYSLNARWDARRILDLEESQVLSLLADGQVVYAGTGNNGTVVRLDYGGPREGTYTSEVLDAGFVAQWGSPDWVSSGGGSMTMETRVGQIAEPGDLWSDWVGLRDSRIASPAGRFLQWRVSLRGTPSEALVLRDMRIPYRGPNRAPEITDVAVATAWADFQSAANGSRAGSVRQSLPGGIQVEYTFEPGPPGSPASLPRVGLWARTLRSATWKAVDPDLDELEFDLYLRVVGEDDAWPLKEDLEDTVYTWDSSAWPEGSYELKIVGRDEGDNPPGEGLTAERWSDAFQIDNTPPTLIDLAIGLQDGRPVVTGRAQDALSRIAAIEYSLNGEGWRPATPEDGILDSRAESFRIPVPDLPDGTRPSVIGIRVADEVGHVASGRLRSPLAP
jgi:hypothetical protein